MKKLITYAEAKAKGIENIVITEEEFQMWVENPIHSKPIDEEIDEEEEVE